MAVGVCMSGGVKRQEAGGLGTRPQGQIQDRSMIYIPLPLSILLQIEMRWEGGLSVSGRINV